MKKRNAKASVLACLEAVQKNLYPNKAALQVAVGCGTRATKVLWDMGILRKNDGWLCLAENIPSITTIMHRYYNSDLPVPGPTQQQLELALPVEMQEQKLLGLIRSIASKLPDGTTIQIRCNGAWQIKSDGF